MYWVENSMGRPWFSWEENIRKDSLLLLNITVWRRSAEDRNICRHTTKEANAQCGLSCYWRWGSCFYVTCIPTDPIILSNFITDSSFFNFQLNQAFALPPAQFSNVCQLFYFQSTSVNYHCHLSDTQHNVTELTTDTIFKKRSNTCCIPSQLSYSHHGHWNKPPWPTNVKNPRDPKKTYTIQPYLL